ncbi:hypothetical protein J4Q44_G00126380 [Coregonus suidteri]|uniref:Protein MIS12 homolog n=1 Tax=Coregonus suidteri TaxID=861788 RepID=A0AAN8QZW4_9TELE
MAEYRTCEEEAMSPSSLKLYEAQFFGFTPQTCMSSLAELKQVYQAEVCARQALLAELEEQREVQEQLDGILRWIAELQAAWMQEGMGSFHDSFPVTMQSVKKMQAVIGECTTRPLGLSEEDIYVMVGRQRGLLCCKGGCCSKMAEQWQHRHRWQHVLDPVLTDYTLLPLLMLLQQAEEASVYWRGLAALAKGRMLRHYSPCRRVVVLVWVKVDVIPPTVEVLSITPLVLFQSALGVEGYLYGQ